MAKTILITGGTGLVGQRLTTILGEKGYQVRHLSRNPRPGNTVPTFKWDVEKEEVDPQALTGIEAIIHLAGAGVADKKWSKARKKEIRDSRIKSTQLLAQSIKNNRSLKVFVTASAIGYYGYDSGGVWKKEESRFGDDFLATVTKDWENEADEIAKLDFRVVKLRIGIVLSGQGGALKQISKPIAMGVGAPLGKGDQFMSWIHIDDLCRMFIQAVETEQMQGVYNAVAPNPVTNKEFTRSVANILGRPLWLPAVPPIALKLMLGEMASIVLGGSRVSSQKVEDTGFTFDFPNLESALNDLLK